MSSARPCLVDTSARPVDEGFDSPYGPFMWTMCRVKANQSHEGWMVQVLVLYWVSARCGNARLVKRARGMAWGQLPYGQLASASPARRQARDRCALGQRRATAKPWRSRCCRGQAQ